MSEKPCQGIKLAPMKMSALAATPAATGAAAAAPKNAYVPPCRRKDTPTELKPKTITTDELASNDLFPTLGGPSGSLKTTAGATWGQIRTKLNTVNSFSALSEDTETPGTPSSAPTTPLNFKGMMKERIEKDKAEEALLQMEETDDPAEMNDAQLRKNGWAKLTLPPKDTESRKQWCEAFHTRLEQLDGIPGPGPLFAAPAGMASSPTKTKKSLGAKGTAATTLSTPLADDEDAADFFSDSDSESSFDVEEDEE